jgi:uncharacterized membrane protein YczE
MKYAMQNDVAVKIDWQTRLAAATPRLLYMIGGILVLSLGIAMSRASLLGTSPMSCISAFVSYIGEGAHISWLSMGWCVFWFNLACFAAEVALLREKFPPVQLLQIPVLVMSTVPIDLFGELLAAVPMDTYAARFAMMAAGILVVALGVHMEVKANVVMLPGEAVVAVAAHVSGKEFGRVKIAVDVACMVVGAGLSLAVLGGMYGVGEGTLIAAVATGLAVNLWDRLLAGFEAANGIEGEPLIEPVVPCKR